ncbi:tail terminator [Microbacterium phage Johann]|uniref:Tail terminator n=2 Tax=Goodmanvirus goodman TaxID=2734238 RepID=A0A3G3LZV4_9CAUD|nr:tail terminator [Microbacterium phage Goodman]AYQ99472.1 tail terminator [Microbacterium phage Goodman]AYQ99640.1 tail terminator [Microbacterium phage Johann]
MSFTENLVNGLGAYLGDLPLFTWRQSGNYQPGEWGLFAMTAPQNTRAVVIRPFDTQDDPSLSDSVVSVQFEFRGSKAEVVQGIDAVFDALHGFWGGKIGGVKVQTVLHTPGSPLTVDEAGNYRHTDNYDLKVHRPSTHRQ